MMDPLLLSPVCPAPCWSHGMSVDQALRAAVQPLQVSLHPVQLPAAIHAKFGVCFLDFHASMLVEDDLYGIFFCIFLRGPFFMPLQPPKDRLVLHVAFIMKHLFPLQLHQSRHILLLPNPGCSAVCFPNNFSVEKTPCFLTLPRHSRERRFHAKFKHKTQVGTGRRCTYHKHTFQTAEMTYIPYFLSWSGKHATHGPQLP